MPRPPAIHRIAPLIEAATELFIDRGYRRTQMADVSAAMGVSPGAIYRYVEGKEALFHLVLQAAVNPDAAPNVGDLPIPTPAPDETVALVSRTLANAARVPLLSAAAATDDCPDAAAELATIAHEMFQLMSRYRYGIKLADRCALDWPDLAALWQNTSRESVPTLIARYLSRRIAGGHLRPVPSVDASARLFMELITTFAVHIHWDRFPTDLTQADAEAAVVDNLMNAYIAPAS